MADLKLGTTAGGYLVIHTNNFNSYAPKLDGTGATGTWGISISGNAATATSSTSATSATSAGYVVNTVTGTNTIEIVRVNMADNDYFRILVGGTASNAGYAEIATADDGTEPIYVRQYSGNFASLLRTLTLLDSNGNTLIPGNTGIGTTNPDGLLTLKDNYALSLMSPSPGYGAGIRYDTALGENLIISTKNSNTKILFSTGFDVTANQGGNSNVPSTPSMSISNGNIGIAMSSPGYRLEIAPPTLSGSIPTAVFRLSGAQNWGNVLMLKTDGGNDNSRIQFNYRGGSKYWSIGGYNSSGHNGISIVEDTNGNWGTERLTVAVGGNVGVNTTTPSEKLSVVGNIAFGTTEGKAKMIYNSTENSIDFIIN